MLRNEKRGNIKRNLLPCAGITLIRFYGFNLSLHCLYWVLVHAGSTPGNLCQNRLRRFLTGQR